jgi:hypothetical protein
MSPLGTIGMTSSYRGLMRQGLTASVMSDNRMPLL